MGAIIDALSASLRAHGGEVMVGKPVAHHPQLGRRGARRRHEERRRLRGADRGLGASARVITVTSLVDDTSVWGDLKPKMKRKPMRGHAFKVVLALDGMPRFAGARVRRGGDAACRRRSSASRPALDYLEDAHTDMLRAGCRDQPVIWGLCPSMTSPALAPPGKHVLSLNVGNAPYRLREGTWAAAARRLRRARDRQARRMHAERCPA